MKSCFYDIDISNTIIFVLWSKNRRNKKESYIKYYIRHLSYTATCNISNVSNIITILLTERWCNIVGMSCILYRIFLHLFFIIERNNCIMFCKDMNDVYNRFYIFYVCENFTFSYIYNFLPFPNFWHALSVFFRRDVWCTFAQCKTCSLENPKRVCLEILFYKGVY